ncbi:MAG: hypothetical protein ACREOS_03705 [Candidatus Dormibacteraceae bacterium]
MNADSERLLELAADIGERVAGVLQDAVPPQAQTHLLNAQRELLTALLLIYEHQVKAHRPARVTARARPLARRSAADSPVAERPPGKRPRRIPID